MKPIDLYAAASQCDTEQWYRTLMGTVDNRQWNGFELPGFPPVEMQTGFVGSANQHALTEAVSFYRAVHEHLSRQRTILGPDDNVLDFGCGWGRYMRFFYRDVRWDRLYGIDPWHEAIEVCKSTGVYGQLLKSELLPPTPLRSSMFKLIFAYSVFSHLSPMAAEAWIAEFARVIAPGGLVVVTTQGRSFIDFCASLRGAPPETEWHRLLQQSFVDETKAKRDYDNGEFLYAPNTGGPELHGDIYGDSVVPEGYVRRIWSKYFDVVDFIDDRSYLPQALIVMRAKP